MTLTRCFQLLFNEGCHLSHIGEFQCASTGLVFVMAQEAELLYRTVPWEESHLRSAGKKAAGPLFNVKSSDEAAVCQLHLPHSETEDGKDI
ncbi:hypothetical protein F7725_021170 [Dissostichus mawsoni]|uniref:FIIND domain-containing protein n=1 Tax=Dissostichus mawsoni TaxID=36200 RepID=A0A7J5YF97_DISMA|nr:hypothetical protein F7725_021170 [Dissostichus mawsoni]